MFFIDTHTHLYLEQFDTDRAEMIQRAFDNNVNYMLLPNIDSSSIKSMMNLCDHYPKNCFPMMGLHPTSVKENYKEELKKMEEQFSKRNFNAVGEIGIDLYWDKTFKKEQEDAFRFQIELALEKNLPIVIHSRESFDDIFFILEDYRNSGFTGVFHCFTGTSEQADKITELGFKLGIGGVITFKNSRLDKVIAYIDLSHIILETDAPYLTPTPHRGKRNESAYIPLIADKIAQIKNTSLENVAKITTQNAIELFNLPLI